MRKRRLQIVLLIFTFSYTICAQSYSNLRLKTIAPTKEKITLDTLTILPSSLVMLHSTGDTIPEQYFSMQNTNLILDSSFLKKKNSPDSIQIFYRVLPVNLQKPTFRLDSAIVLNDKRFDSDVPIEYDYSTIKNKQSIPWQNEGLQTNGTYTRGLALGNNQNLSFNSNLNLQLAGKLGDDLEIAGVLSDNSIPLQPDGTTASIQEFDRIFLQIKKRNTTLTAGDNDLPANPFGRQNHFTRYFKRLQGAQVEYRTPVPSIFSKKSTSKTKNDSLYIRTAAAVSKGKFNRQIIQAGEGNQGPYRLQGAENERFIIILAGTERVWVDGILLKRGQGADYVIDYNLAELTFTTRQLMTKDKRITIEFEYAVQNYLRSTITADTEWRKSNGNRVYFSAYSEQDGLSGGGLQNLSPAQRSILANAGDDRSLSSASGVDTLENTLDVGRVLYKYIDTVICGVNQRVLEYTTSPDSGLYAARFSEVPSGFGNYIRIGSAANGRVYQWVAPDAVTCQPQGQFEPIVQLIAPEQRQLFTLGADWSFFKKKTNITVESSLSNRDINRFSPLDADDNNGLASYLEVNQILFENKKWNSSLGAAYEYTQENFKALNQYRSPEFTRDWNQSLNQNPTENHLAHAEFILKNKSWGELKHQTSIFQLKDNFEGLRNQSQIRIARNGWKVNLKQNLLKSDGLQEKTSFWRPIMDISKTFLKKKKTPLLTIGTYVEREKNQRKNGLSDSLNTQSFWYDLSRIYMKMPENESRKWTIGGQVQERKDYAPSGTEFINNTTADEISLDGNAILSAGKNKQNILWNGTYRTLKINRADLTTQDPQETWLGRVDYNLFSLNNALSFTSGYEAGSGQQPKTEFNYVQVNPGDGQYTWIDRNADSIIQINEMEQAVFQDQARFIRVAVTTNDFVSTRNLNFNATLRVDPRLYILRPKNASNTSNSLSKKLLSTLSTLSAIQINRKVLSRAENINPWNPFELNVADTALVNVSSSIRNTLFINRSSRKWGLTLNQSEITNRYLLTTGLEGRNQKEYSGLLRYNFAKTFTFETEIKRGLERADAENFPLRSFDIAEWSSQPKISWLPNRSFRLSINYTYRKGQNREGALETANIHQGQSELSWNPMAKEQPNGFRPSSSIRAKMTIASIQYSGAPNTAISYAILDGLQNGRNLIWSASIDRQLNKSMQLSFVYEGRKTGAFNIIHTGRAQVRAVF